MYLGIDLGTSSVKIVLLDESAELIAESSCRLSIQHPKALWSEQHPKDWWKATNVAIQNLQKSHSKSLGAVKAIGLSGQQHGAVLLDKRDKVLRPAILWNDGRSHAECEEIERRVPHFAKITGNRIMPGFTAPKLLWIKEHEPDIFASMSKTLLPKDYLRLKMTGEYASDMSDASGTMWLNVGARTWSDDMLTSTDMRESQMPKLFEGSEVTGKVLPEIALSWGIPSSAVVVGGGGDNAASALSSGVFKPGSAFLSLGSSGVYFVATKDFKPHLDGGVHTMCHCLPGLWHQMSVHLSCASCLDWWKTAVQEPSVGELLKETESKHRTGSGVYFLPYLSGERSPHNDPHARGVFFGLSHSSGRCDMTRAVLEGIAFNFRAGEEAMRAAGTPIERVSVVGGGATSLYWGRILASALEKPLEYHEDRQVGGAFGAARLAFLGANGGDPAEVFAPSPLETIIEPDPKLVERYHHKQKIFGLLYERLADVFKQAYEGI